MQHVYLNTLPEISYQSVHRTKHEQWPTNTTEPVVEDCFINQLVILLEILSLTLITVMIM